MSDVTNTKMAANSNKTTDLESFSPEPIFQGLKYV